MQHHAMASSTPTAPSNKTGGQGGGMGMASVFSTNIHVTLFFTEWTTTTVAAYVATVMFLFFLTLFNRFLAALRYQLERVWSRQAQSRNILSAAPTGRKRRAFLKAKASPIPTYMLRQENSEWESLTNEEGGDDWSICQEQSNKNMSIYQTYGHWQPTGPWSIKKDSIRAIMEFSRALIGYLL